MKLKIHANSTRRARWDSKLGYSKHPGPFNVSLKSVWGNGGNITKLRICVLRVYPVVYIDPKNLSGECELATILCDDLIEELIAKQTKGKNKHNDVT